MNSKSTNLADFYFVSTVTVMPKRKFLSTKKGNLPKNYEGKIFGWIARLNNKKQNRKI